MTRLAPILLSILAATALQPARAACNYPGEINIPSGASATEADMQTASQAVKRYMAEVESYLACLDQEEKDLGDAVTEEQKKVHTQRHNAAVDALNAVAARFNEQLRLYKKKTAK